MNQKLNSLNEKTKKVIHLMVTTLCARNCKYCCNKQYSLDDVPYVTDSELKDCEILCITGGEPFLFSNPCTIGNYYKNKYPNIKKVFVYTNALELSYYLKKYNHNSIYGIDGVNVSIKLPADKRAFTEIVNHYEIQKLTGNRLYVFGKHLIPEDTGNFEVFERNWQPDFKPADDSIFRKI